MPRYKLRYARLVILETEFEAGDEDEANAKAFKMENAGKLTIAGGITPPQNVILKDVQDYEHIWDITPVT